MDALPEKFSAMPHEPMVRQRVRIRFCKQEDLRWIGHRDLMRCLERTFRRARLPLSFSEGFHPKPRMAFPAPLALGIEGLDEIMELELSETYTAAELLARLEPHTPPGLAFRSAAILPEGCKKARPRSVCYQMPVPPPHGDGLPRRIERLLDGSSCPIRREGDRGPIDPRPLLAELTFQNGMFSMRLLIGGRENVRPREMLAALELDGLEQAGVRLTRTAVEIDS